MAKEDVNKRKLLDYFKIKGAWIGAAIPICLFLLSVVISFFGKDSKHIIVILAKAVILISVMIFNLFVGFLIKCPVVDWGLWHAPKCNDAVYLICVPLFFGIVGFVLGLSIVLLARKIKRRFH